MRLGTFILVLMVTWVTFIFLFVIAAFEDQRDDAIIFHGPDGSAIQFNKKEFVAALRPTVDVPPGSNAQIDAANGKTYYVQETLRQIEDKLK